MLASSEGHESIVQMLLSHGADPHITNASQLTALDVAVMNAHKNIEAVLSPLLESRSKIRPTLVLPPFNLSKRVPSCESVATCSYKSSMSSGYPERSPCPCTPAYALHLDSHSPKIFKFPPSSSFTHCSTVHMARQYSPFSYLSHSVSPTFGFPCDKSHLSPTFCPSPLLPPWMFAYGHWQHKVESKPVFKKRKRLRNWWKKLKKR